MSHIHITGASGSSPRLEIHTLVKIDDQFSLYIQALAAMFSTKEIQSTSHFLLGGIHGLPYKQWEGSGGTGPVGSWDGYCTHGTVLFPTWHRPYVALYEQVLQTHAQQIAKTYKVDSQKWAAAADALRAPYWDWAMNALPPDEVIANAKVTITTPDGKRTSVDNPLWGYHFQTTPEPQFDSPFSHWPKTLRHPTSQSASAKDDVAGLKRLLQSEASQLTKSVYQLLAYVNTWPEMSNHTSGNASNNSLETIHDKIHVLVGSGGHMNYPAYAGMDPIFFLHHANVDRLFALWQALHSNVWVSSGSAEAGTWTIKAGATLDATSALTPFWSGDATYWNSASIRDWTVLGYDYPEFKGLDRGNPTALRTAIAKKVTDLYLNAGNQAARTFLATSLATSTPRAPASVPADVPKAVATDRSAPVQGQKQFVAQAASADSGGQAKVAVANPDDDGTSVYEWTARVRTKQHELGGSFTVTLFLGPVPENPVEWEPSPSYVGAHHAFVNHIPQRCANCEQQADAEIETFIHLNDAIARTNLGSLEPSVVEPYLKAHLEWRIQKADRTVVPVSDLPSLEIEVLCTPLFFRPGDIFPTQGEVRHYPEITRGVPGGHA